MRQRKIEIANPGDKAYGNPAWVLAFGAYGCTYVLAYADSLEDALDECVDWIADNAPGLLCDDSVEEEYKRQIAGAIMSGEDPSDESVIERSQDAATVDTTCAGNAGHYLVSWEWTICLENPDKRTLIAFAKGE